MLEAFCGVDSNFKQRGTRVGEEAPPSLYTPPPLPSLGASLIVNYSKLLDEILMTREWDADTQQRSYCGEMQ